VVVVRCWSRVPQNCNPKAVDSRTGGTGAEQYFRNSALVACLVIGVATIRLEDGTFTMAEVDWYEASGIGRRELKIKYLLD